MNRTGSSSAKTRTLWLRVISAAATSRMILPIWKREVWPTLTVAAMVRLLSKDWPYAAELGRNYQRADHASAGGFIGMGMAVESIRTGLRGLEECHVALARWNERMDIELVDVKIVGRGIGVLQP